VRNIFRYVPHCAIERRLCFLLPDFVVVSLGVHRGCETGRALVAGPQRCNFVVDWTLKFFV